MQHLCIFILASLFFVSCGDKYSAELPTPKEANVLVKQKLSSCKSCGIGFVNDTSKCEPNEECIGLTIIISGAPVNTSTCQRTFVSTEGKKYSYSCK